MKILRYGFVFLLSFAFILKPQELANSICSGYDPDYYETYQFFEPLSFEELSEFEWKADSTEADNLSEWKNYFKNKPKLEDIDSLVYKYSADEMQKIRAAVLNSKTNLSNKLKDNSLVKYLIEKKDINERDALETLDYLFYAKVCEPEATNDEQWTERKRDVEKMKWLADNGKKYYKEKASNDFLRLRFAYQAIRMAHYSGQYQKAIKFYDELVEPISIQTESIIRHWALALKAGALKKSGKKAEAAYLFSVVFDKCHSRRASSFLSFQIENDTEWRQAINLGKNNSEKSTLHFLRSLAMESDGLIEMQNIYKLEPESEKLPFMLVRQINKLENDLLSIDLSKNLLFLEGYKGMPRAQALKSFEELKTFVNQGIKENKVKRNEIWQLANAYLDYVAGNTAKANQTFSDLAKSSKNKTFKKQIEVFQLAIQISGLTKITDEVEEDIYIKVKSLKHTHLHDFMVNAFARLYDKQGEKGKAYLCRKGNWELKTEPQMDIIENLLVLTDKKKLTDFEKDFLLNKIATSYEEKSKFNAKEILLEIKATLLFGQDKLEEAIAIYKQIPENAIYKLEQDPLQANLKDCQDCPNSVGKGKYNRLTLAQKILQLKKIAEKNTVEQAQVYFQLGNVYYNLTHFGNSWLAIDYYRSGSDLWYLRSKDKTEQASVMINVDCGKAKYYFERAMNGAIKAGNRELATQSCFMAAKCEQNEYYLKSTEEIWGDLEPNFEPQNRRYFTRLKQEFKDTQYYKEILRECTYFQTFVKKNK